MTRSLSIAYLKAHLSEVLGGVARRGDRVTINKRGKPVATLAPPDPEPAARPRGFVALAGLFADAPELSDELDKIVRNRRSQRKGRLPKLAR
jgi:prevent-host-death family protein